MECYDQGCSHFCTVLMALLHLSGSKTRWPTKAHSKTTYQGCGHPSWQRQTTKDVAIGTQTITEQGCLIAQSLNHTGRCRIPPLSKVKVDIQSMSFNIQTNHCSWTQTVMIMTEQFVIGFQWEPKIDPTKEFDVGSTFQFIEKAFVFKGSIRSWAAGSTIFIG